jgi:deoxyribonuclease V
MVMEAQLNESQLISLQEQLARQVIIPPDREGYQPHPGDLLFSLDVQYEGQLAYGAVDIQAWPDEHVETWVGRQPVTIAYKPQFFCFREGPLLVAILNKLLASQPLSPALILVDGHGLAHPRRLGLASWLGVQLDIPTLGCAKRSLLPYNKEGLELRRGNYRLIEDRGEPVGAALVTQDGIGPVFVSPGHQVNLAVTIKVILQLAQPYRLPEPLRRADHAARSYARGMLSSPIL